MKLTDIDYETLVKITDFENFLTVTERDGLYRFNLNNTLYLDIAEDGLFSYELKTPAHWPLISYKLYETTRLAWLLMKINGVGLKDSLRLYLPGEKIKYLSKDNVQEILKALD